MNKVFKYQYENMLEIYMGDMILKSEEKVYHTIQLKEVIFSQIRNYNMQHNPKKKKKNFWSPRE